MNRKRFSGRVLIPAILIIIGLYALHLIFDEWLDVGKGSPFPVLVIQICVLVGSIVCYLICYLRSRGRYSKPKDNQKQ